MKSMFTHIMFTAIISMFLFSFAHAEQKTNDMQIFTANEWLFLIDNGEYGKSWERTSAYFKGAVTEQNWILTLNGFRKPLGKVIQRRMDKMEQVDSLPGAPDGKYTVVTFSTTFEKKEAAIETLTFVLDKDKTWKAAGYFVK